MPQWHIFGYFMSQWHENQSLIAGTYHFLLLDFCAKKKIKIDVGSCVLTKIDDHEVRHRTLIL